MENVIFMSNHKHPIIKLRWAIGLILLLDFYSISHANPISNENTEKVRRAEKLGLEIYNKDVASARATDVLFEHKIPQTDSRVKGWITVPNKDGWLVRFIGEDGGTMAVLYDIEYMPRQSAKLLKRYDPPHPLSSAEASQFLARQTALQSGFKMCSRKYNTVVLPADNPEDGWTVYLIAATTNSNQIMLGGHHRILASKDGSHVIESTALTKSCIAQERHENAVFIYVSHLISSTPIETHVLLSLLHKIPIIVVTELGPWKVIDGKILFISPNECEEKFYESNICESIPK